MALGRWDAVDVARGLAIAAMIVYHFFWDLSFLQLAPTKIDLITRTAVNGSWFNFFLCGASGFVVLPGVDPSTTNGITVPAGGLNNAEAGCG